MQLKKQLVDRDVGRYGVQFFNLARKGYLSYFGLGSNWTVHVTEDADFSRDVLKIRCNHHKYRKIEFGLDLLTPKYHLHNGYNTSSAAKVAMTVVMSPAERYIPNMRAEMVSRCTWRM